jgi:hypothetical protein
MADFTLYPYNRCRLASTIAVTANPGANASYPIANIYDLDRQTYWAGANTTSGYVTFDFGSATTIGAIAFGNHNLATIAASIFIEHDDNAGFTSPLGVDPVGTWPQEFFPASNDDFLLQFGVLSDRYWRIYFDNLGAVPKCGEIAFLSRDAADHIVFSASAPLFPVGRGWRRRVGMTETEGGIIHVTQRGIGAGAHVASNTQEPRVFDLSFNAVDGAAANSARANLAAWMRALDGMWRPFWMTANDWSSATGRPAYHVVLDAGDWDESIMGNPNRNRFNLRLVTAL